MKPYEALAKIKILIDKYFDTIEKADGSYLDTEEMRINLIGDIDDIVDKAKIPKKYIFVEKL